MKNQFSKNYIILFNLPYKDGKVYNINSFKNLPQQLCADEIGIFLHPKLNAKLQGTFKANIFRLHAAVRKFKDSVLKELRNDLTKH